MIDGQPLTADDRDTATKLRELERKTEVIRPAIARQKEAVDLIRGELSAAAARLVRDRHRKALANILDAARALIAASAAERSIRAELLERNLCSNRANVFPEFDRPAACPRDHGGDQSLRNELVAA
jgi:hypothetical protein